MRRTLLLAVVVAAALLAVPAANAKEFRPGDLRLCNATRCVAVVNGPVLARLAGFYYRGPRPVRTARPPLGVPYYELRFRNGYVTGIVATRRLDRFLTYGVHDHWFLPHAWYAVPRPIASELRRLADGLRPLRLTRAALAKSR
jgi:hypothetical protein